MKQFEPFRLDVANGCLWREGTQIALPPKPFAVLQYLVENPGRLVTHDELLDALWPETFVQPQVLRTYMLELRKALGDDAGQPRFIQTQPKRGYRFVAEVTDGAGTVRAAVQATAQVALCEIKPSGFVNRSDELARLKREFERLGRGERRVVFVTGEAGIGKTALVDAFCRAENFALPTIVARGQCVAGVGGKEEYYPVMEALGQLCASADGDAACSVLARIAPAWLARLGRAAGTVVSDGSLSTQERMPGQLCAALEELAAIKPLILVLEDLHWADESTLNLISALALRRAPARLMVLATWRQRGVPAGHPLKAFKQDLRVRKLCEEIALAPLSKISLQQLVSGELKQDVLPEGLSAFVHRHSEGNPLFAIAILEHLIAHGCLACRTKDGATVWELRMPLEEAGAGVPEELAQMVELEIERLNPLEQSALEAGSLTPIAFSAWAVAAALEKDAAEIEELCDELVRRVHFVERAGEDELPGGASSTFYVFAHGLYREVLYQRQTATRRAQRHERIADRLGTLFAGREADVAREMATHYEAAGNWQRAAAALDAAAQHAERRQAYSEAADLEEHARRVSKNLKISDSSSRKAKR
jgi:DNA-binding winged helix-turn-helix (wHTH) protein